MQLLLAMETTKQVKAEASARKAEAEASIKRTEFEMLKFHAENLV